MRWFDTHCHLDRLPGALPVGEALCRAHDAGVGRFLVPGVTGMPLLSDGDFHNEKIQWAWGVHPGFIEMTELCGPEDAPWQASGIRPSAIGECGLDERLDLPVEIQTRAFCAQLELARHHHLPVIVHLVGYARRGLELLRSYAPDAGFVMHSFSGSPEMAVSFVAAGGSISLSASCLRNPEKLKRLMATVPLSALLLETDAPDMTLSDWPGICNEPAALPAIGARIAEISGIDVEKLAEVLYTNASRVFSVKSP